jgi:hypothetical protein
MSLAGHLEEVELDVAVSGSNELWVVVWKAKWWAKWALTLLKATRAGKYK